MTIANDLLRYDTIADLKLAAVAPGTQVLVLGKTLVGDGLGGFYRWDSTSVDAEDTTFLNVVQATNVTTGRWVRVFQRARQLPHGVLVMSGGIKTFYANGATDSNGKFALNLTMDNTTTGTAIFSEIWSNRGEARAVSADLNNAIGSYKKTETTKLTEHIFYKPNVVTLTLGLLLSPFVNVTAGINVSIKVEGI